jgi:hypothetical protein
MYYKTIYSVILLLTAVLFPFVIFSSDSYSQGIVCAPQPFDIKEKFNNSELVFLGKVDKLEKNEATFTPLIVWKGHESIGESVSAKLVMFDLDKNKQPELGKEYLVFSENVESSKFTLSPCNYFGKKEDVEPDISSLNTITPGEQHSSWARSKQSWILAIAALTGLGIIIGGAEFINLRHKKVAAIL